MPTNIDKYLDPAALDETVFNIRQIVEDLEEEMQNLPYARPDGLYPDMTVGTVIGADETAQWATRESTGTGSATVRSVQGAAVAWNQLNMNNGYASITGVTAVNNNNGSWTLNGTATADGGVFITSTSITLKAGHKYLVKGCPSGGSATTYYLGLGGTLADTGNGGIQTIASDSTTALQLIIKSGATFDNVTIWPQVFDLTQMFGSGNEPTTVAEFEQMYTAAYYPYSAPTLKPVQISGIQSTTAQGGELDAIEWTAQTLRAAGSVRDELTAGELVTRVGVVQATGGVNFVEAGYNGTSANVQVPLGLAATAGINFNSDQFVKPSGDGAWRTLQVGEARVTASGVWMGLPADITTNAQANAWMAEHKPIFWYALATPTTTPISPALPMTYKVQQGGSESIIVPDGEVSAAPVLTVAEPVNMSTELARIWAAIESLGYTRNAAQLSRPVSLADIGSIDEVQKDTTEIETIKEVKE